MKRRGCLQKWLPSVFSPLFLSIDIDLHGQVGKYHGRLLNEDWLRVESLARNMELSAETYTSFSNYTNKLESVNLEELRDGLRSLEGLRGQAEGPCLLNNIGHGLIKDGKSEKARGILEKARGLLDTVRPILANNDYNHISRTIRANLNDIDRTQKTSNVR